MDMEEPFFVSNDEQRLDYINYHERMRNAMSSFPSSRDGKNRDRLIGTLRRLIIDDLNQCTLCSVQEFANEEPGGDDADTHKISVCYYQNYSVEASIWLNIFKQYEARVDGPGARCYHCRFPSLLCWRTIHRQMLNNRFGNEEDAQKETGKGYPVVLCNWVQPICDFIAACMVADGKIEGTGVSLVGATALHCMEWEDWKGLDEKGPAVVRPWLEEADSIGDLKCPRLLKLYWLLASVKHVCLDLDDGSDSEMYQ